MTIREEIQHIQQVLDEIASDEPTDTTARDAAGYLNRLVELRSCLGSKENNMTYNDIPVLANEEDDFGSRAVGHNIDRGNNRGHRKSEFKGSGDFLSAVIRAGMPGGELDPRLARMQKRATGLGEMVPSEGGFLVDTDTEKDILKRAYETGQVAKLCRQIQISSGSNSVKINAVDEISRATGSRWGGVRGYWLQEAGEKTASKPKFRQMELTLKKLIGLCYLTDELLQDVTAMESIVRQAFAEEIAFMLDDSIINGGGAGTPLGIMNAACKITVTKETNQTAATINPHNLSKMWGRLWGKSKKNAVWLVNQDVTQALMTLQLQDSYAGSPTFGVPVFLPGGAVKDAPWGTIFGRPVIECESCQTLGTEGDIILADLSEYILAVKGPLQVDTSIHVRFVYDESAIRFVYRADGQPAWNAALTPFKGSNTVSPFITLQTRS